MDLSYLINYRRKLVIDNEQVNIDELNDLVVGTDEWIMI